MTIRLTGISNSGLDTDALVKSLMTAKRANYDKIGQQKTQAEWKKTDYNTMYKALNDFRNNTILNFKMSSSLSAKLAASSTEAIATATATAGAVNFPHTLQVTKLATSASMASSAAVSGSLGISSNTTVKINGIDIPVDAVSTLNDFASAINNTAGLNVKANYDATLNRFFLYSTNSGADAKIDLSGNGSNAEATTILNNLKLNTAVPTVAAGNLGENAQFTLDGVSSATLGITTNEFTISGVKYSLKGAGTTNITVSSDNDKVIANVKAFIASYNTMLGLVNTEVNETKYKDFLPLTSEQRADMSDTEITVWEAKAKSGMLRNDPTLSTLAYGMRDSFSSPISGLTGSYTTASSIGITSGAYSEKGKLYLDEDKLRKALEADPQIVQKIFGSDGDTASKDGIAVRLYDGLQTAIDKIKIDAGTSDSASSDVTSNLGKKIKEYEKTLTDMNRRLLEMEETYYKKFSAMETALSKLNSQSSWLAQQLGQSS
ncbi:MAG: flagellar capping protein [Pelosinus sp.]|jgi:flagellar hook-associated protein 2|nr:flagellar capping protein [Pelosinus sp.]